MLERESGFDFEVLASRHFIKEVDKLRDALARQRVYEVVAALARSRSEWRRVQAKKLQTGLPHRSLRGAHVGSDLRLLWEGPITTNRYDQPVLFVHAICDHDSYAREIRRVAGAPLEDISFEELELEPDEPDDQIQLPSEIVAFAKPLPSSALLSPELVERILQTKANILLTAKQMDVLEANRPILIHGQAGSGKTTILCHRLALSALELKRIGEGRLAFLSYNDKLVELAKKDTSNILESVHSVPADLTMVDFVPFRDFLKRYVPNPHQFQPGDYVPFGRFKRLYEIYSRGDPAIRKIPAEVAWHGIRSLLKGACVPPARPPLSREDYEQLARRRRDFPEDLFEHIYTIGQWYQTEIIRERGLWDDQDLAWAALDWVQSELTRNPAMNLYDEIFCDEVQDLTEIEAKLLINLCKPPPSTGEEGLLLSLSGDPLQTINPTGFRWSVIRAEIFRTQGRSVELHELEENFRSDHRIVGFANRLQEKRAFYMQQQLTRQEAFEKDGDFPNVVIVETEDETAAIRDKLGELPPESAVIVWPDHPEEIESLLDAEEPLKKVDRQLDLYSVSEAKGLEFQLVVLYKVGSSPEARRWREYLTENRNPKLIDEIPLLYFLNRLYVAVTRAKAFLFVVDTPSASKEFWDIWKDSLSFPSRPDIQSVLEDHPAFQGEMSPKAWKRWADTLFDQAERSRDLRLYERARRAYEKGRELQKIKRVDARIAETLEEWSEAGDRYLEIQDFERAGFCFGKAKQWQDAHDAYSHLPTTPEVRRRLAVYRYKVDRVRNRLEAALEFFDWAMVDDGLERVHLDELVQDLVSVEDSARSVKILVRIADLFGDREAFATAAIALYEGGEFRRAIDYFERGECTHLPEYELAQAEVNLTKDRPQLLSAAKTFLQHSKHDRIVDIWARCMGPDKPDTWRLETAELQSLRAITASAYYETGQYENALPLYENLGTTSGKAFPAEDLQKFRERAGDCLEKLGREDEALHKYRQARVFEKALDLAHRLDRPRAELLSIGIEAARDEGDFARAASLANELGDQRLVHEVRGYGLKYNRKYSEAAKEFAEAKIWGESLECVRLATLPFDQWYAVGADILNTLVRSRDRPKSEERRRFMDLISRLRVDPIWESYVKPEDMGLAYELCASPSEAATYYESRLPERWAKDGWLRVKTKQSKHFRGRGDLDRAQRIEGEITTRKAVWSTQEEESAD